MRIGLGLPPLGMAMDLCSEIVQRAESAGFDSVWVGEAWGTETCTMVGALLARSQRIHIGTGIVSLYLRPPTLTAMQAATLDLIAPGRARLGLGVSTRNINTFHGLDWDFRWPGRASTWPCCAGCWPENASATRVAFTDLRAFS